MKRVILSILVLVPACLLGCGRVSEESIADGQVDSLSTGETDVGEAATDSAGDLGDVATVCPSVEPGTRPCLVGLTCTYNFNCGFDIATHRTYWCDGGRFALLVADPGCVDGGIN